MKWRTLITGLLLCTLCTGHASALEYTVDETEDYQFGPVTSVDGPYTKDEVNVDRSKNVSLIPPGFGTPTSYLPGSGEYLTPNLVPGALNGGLVPSVGTVNYPAVDSGGGISGIPAVEVSYTAPFQAARFTAVTAESYYSGGHLGTLAIPVLGVDVKIFEGTDSTQLAKGAGHFTDTSIWDGNVCVAAHNRGTNAYFGQIHTLNIGDTITLTTRQGTRTYAVSSVKKITETDGTDTTATAGNCITLFTCVRDERDFRWCVRAEEVM